MRLLVNNFGAITTENLEEYAPKWMLHDYIKEMLNMGELDEEEPFVKIKAMCPFSDQQPSDPDTAVGTTVWSEYSQYFPAASAAPLGNVELRSTSELRFLLHHLGVSQPAGRQADQSRAEH
eukprot:SAG22_NODE_13157_length_416_cov_1.703470_1_plen_121_part_01